MNRPPASAPGSLRRGRMPLAAIGISVAAVVISVAPILGRGFGMGHDWLLELVRIAEFRHALQGGQGPPYWASNLYGGFGSPIFLFYPPLYLSVAAAFAAGGAGMATAAVGALCVFTVISACLMWRFMRGVVPDCSAAAAVAVVLYALHPYLLADKWIRNANAEFAALSLLPAVLIGVTATGWRRRFWWSSIGLALVILAHNIIALVAITVALGLGFFVHRSLRAMLPVFGGILAALAATAFFWAPAFALQPLIRTEDLLTGKFDFHLHFPELSALCWPTEFYSGGWVTPILAAVVLFAPVADPRARRIARALGLGLLACLFLMFPQSEWLWETLPLLRYTQFPWRFMGPLAVLLAAGGGIASARLLRPRWQVTALIVLLAVAILNAVPAIRQFEPLTSELSSRLEPALGAHGIRSGDLRTTVYDEYLPRGANLSEVKHAEGFRLFKKWAFPVWTATRNGQTVQPEPGPGGVVAVRIDSESDLVALALREPPVRRACKFVSMLTVTILLAIAAVEWWRARSAPGLMRD